jgi:iron complex outermembrane receptor protein
MPPLEAKLSVANDDGTWSAGALWRIVAAQKRYALNEGNVVGKDFGPSAGFGVFSLNGGYAVNKQVQVSLGVDNLFNKTYSEHLNLAGNAGFGYAANTAVNEPGRTVWARVSFKY